LDAVSNAAGQEGWHGAIAGGPIYSTQHSDASFSEPGIPSPGVGGSAPGFVVSGEAALKGPFGVGVELSDISRFTAMQRTGGSSDPALYQQQYRDVIVSALAHVHHRFGDRVGLDVVGGISFVQQDSIQRVATAPQFSSSFGPFGPERSISSNTAAGTLGVDVGVGIMRHVSIGPTLRAHLVSRSRLGTDSNQEPTIFLDLSTLVWRFGGTLRVEF